MDSATLQLPVICFSDKTLKPGSSKWIEVRNDVRKALEEYGCFEASYDKVPKELRENVVAAMEEVFALPVEMKQRNVCPKPYVGYLTYNNNLSESLGIDDANILEKVEEFTQQIWPGVGNKSISKTIKSFAEKLADLDEMVTRMVMESFGIEKYIEQHLNSTNYRVRLMKYISPPDLDANNGDDANNGINLKDDAITAALGVINLKDDDDDDANGVNVDADVKSGDDDSGDDVDGKLGLHCHTDKNLVTIIFQHEIQGLEVRSKDGKWIRVKPSPNTLVIIAADSLYAFLNGRISQVYHRVRVTEKKKTRYSAALFSMPKPGYIIDAPKELVDDKHPRVFKPFDYPDLMAVYHTEAGRTAHSTLHSFFAVAGA